jgi:hypothetical protein
MSHGSARYISTPQSTFRSSRSRTGFVASCDSRNAPPSGSMMDVEFPSDGNIVGLKEWPSFKAFQAILYE